jgi:hypothetical protein
MMSTQGHQHPSEAELLLALDGELDALEAAAVSNHVASCVACRARWEQLSALSGDIAAYCRAWPAATASVTVAPASRRRPAWGTWLAAAAAVLLLAGWAVAAWMMAPHAVATTTAVDVTHASDIALAPPAATAAAPAPRHLPAVRASRGTPRPTRPTYYWSLPYSNNALPLDENTVEMTVNLTREQLRLAGIPVSESLSQNDARVRAKVLLGADGRPRAISFDQD